MPASTQQCHNHAGSLKVGLWCAVGILVVVMEYGDRSWYVCPRTEYILVEKTLSYESNQPYKKKNLTAKRSGVPLDAGVFGFPLKNEVLTAAAFLRKDGHL